MFRPKITILQLCACLTVAAWTHLVAAEPAAVAKPLRVGVENESAPYTFADAQGRPSGFSVELLQAVAQHQGLALEFKVMNWGDLLAAFKGNEIDIICNVADTPERLAFMRFSATTMLMRGGLYMGRESPAIRSVADLTGLRVAVPRDSRAHDYIRRQGWNVRFVFTPNIKECVQAVHDGRADIMLATRLVTDHIIRSEGYGKVVATDLQFPDFDYREHFGVQVAADGLRAQLNEGLLTVYRSGDYNRLYEKWLGPLDPQKLRWRDVQPFLPLLTVLAVATLGIFVWQRRLLHRLSRQARELRESEQQLQLVFEGSQDAFWDWDVPTGRILRSPRWTGMLGYQPEEVGLDHQSFVDLVHPDDRARVLSHNERIRHPQQDHFIREMRMRAKTGEWMWILDRGKMVARDAVTSAPLRITGTHTDISERKRAEAEADKLQHKMEEAQKLESLGVLAGGIAHDFNNLLTVILGNSTLARLESAESPANQARLDAVVTSAHRAAELCHQLLAYAGKGSYSTDRINLNTMVTETTRLLELSISKQAKLEFTLAPALPRIEADPSQIRQVIMNLVINASEALTDRLGVIRISTRVVTLPQTAPGDSTVPTDLDPGDYVCIEVADTGSGMTPDVLARIFDPFFTTKFTGRGLGLAAVIGIVRTHRGTLKVESTPGQGSVFRIYLPVSQTQTAHPFGTATVV